MNKRNAWLFLTSLSAAAVMTASLTGPAVADTIYLKRGGSLNGRIVEGESTIELRMDGGSATFNKSEIERIEKNDIRSESGRKGVSQTLSRWGTQASRAADQAKDRAEDFFGGQQHGRSASSPKKTSSGGLLQPIQRSAAAREKERLLNESMNEMQKALQKQHQREKAISEEKRALKKAGMDIG